MEEVIGSIPLGSTILPFPTVYRSTGSGRSPRSSATRLVFGLALAALACTTRDPTRADDAGAPPAPIPDDAAPALVAALRERILSAHSATLALEGWCAEHALAAEPRLVALRLPGPDKPLTAAQRARLAIGPDEPVRYRRVRLVCGDRALSEADNWYVPARLTPEMNRILDETRTPFGRVVRPLAPVRRTVAVSTAARPSPGEPLFEVDAVLSTGAGEPFCEVVETYLGSALPHPR